MKAVAVRLGAQILLWWPDLVIFPLTVVSVVSLPDVFKIAYTRLTDIFVLACLARVDLF
jgi:hypothetical protein